MPISRHNLLLLLPLHTTAASTVLLAMMTLMIKACETCKMMCHIMLCKEAASENLHLAGGLPRAGEVGPGVPP